MNMKICLMPGDGIGPEIVTQAVKVLEKVAKKFGHTVETETALIGGAAIDAVGNPLPEATVAACKAADAVLLGAVGGPKWDTIDPAIRPEKGLLGIRKALGLFSNLRPAVLFPELAAASYLRPDIIGQGLDIMVVRELTGGAYFGEPRGETVVNGERAAFNTMIYSESEIERIVRVACEIARKRGKKLCSV
ncbi:MAG: isocitrate/isopropylmalate family dehydrogenase, partial [Desulfomicrobium apsheronum]|nr:isocitrate/isopropylmalate family dehydrogenase [Desulfomicrobium apsheronum]